jgi:AraC-like DNA-binding protein
VSTVINILIYAGIVQGFYMAILLNNNKKQNSANIYLAVLLVMMSISIAHSEFVISELHKDFNNPYKIKEPFLMLVIPLIWLYVRKLGSPKFRFTIHTIRHFLPFLIFMSIYFPAYLMGTTSAIAKFLHNHALIFNILIWAVLLVQYTIYLIQIIRSTHTYQEKAEEELSNIEKADLSWIKAFLITFVIIFILLAVMFAGAIHNFNVDWLNKVVSVVFSLATFVLGFKGIFQQSIFSNHADPEVQEATESRITKTRTVDEQMKKVLLDFMEKKKPYQDPELTLTTLAFQMNLSRNQLSEIINSSIGCNFYDFINKYRVEEVKQQLMLSKSENFTLLAIAFDAGFPSKSTFNTIFKKFTGLTPSEYKRGLN